MTARVDVPPGTVFGRLTVIGEAPQRGVHGKRAMSCRCECGTEKTVNLDNLRGGHTRSCGCIYQGAAAEDIARMGPGEVPLYGKNARGRAVLVDEADYDLIMQHRWRIFEIPRKPGRKPHGPYAITSLSRPGDGGREEGIFMHVLLMGQTGIDHADGNGLNNRRSNLRPATNGQNKANTGKYLGCTGFKGVYQNKRTGRWNAQIRVNGHFRNLGTYDDPAEGARAYDAAALEAWGEFARLNFPESAVG